MEASSPPSSSRKWLFKICEDTHQVSQDSHATVFHYDVSMDMVVRVAYGETSHAFLCKNDYGVRAYILDDSTWRSHVSYDAELGSSHCQDIGDEYCAHTSEEDDNDADEDNIEEHVNLRRVVVIGAMQSLAGQWPSLKAKGKANKPKSKAKGQGNVLQGKAKGKGKGKRKSKTEGQGNALQ